MYSPTYSQEDDDTITLKDTQGRTLECYIENSLEVEGTEYLLLMPVDATISIVAWDDQEEAEARLVEEEAEIDLIFSTAAAVLAEQNLSLKRTAYTLTVEGELPEGFEGEILTLEVEDEEGEIIEDELQLLATFYHEEQEYSAYTPADTLLFFAKINPQGVAELLSPEESQQVQPQLESMLADEMFEDT